MQEALGYTIEYYKTGNKKDKKIEKILVDQFPDFYFWDYEEQTKIKHKVLEAYFNVWSIKLGKYGNINYYDGFSGCGAYFDRGEKKDYYGSPIIAKNITIENKRNNVCNFYINEKNEENINNLQAVFKHHSFNTQNVHMSQGDFETNINLFLDKLEKNPIPTFFMIDPYGINVSYKTIARIMNIPKAEILFNFMYNYINRFYKKEENADGISNLYGTDEWKNLDFTKVEKEIAFVNLFREQLKAFSKYAYQYRLSFPDIDKTYYYLFHLTQNIEGCSIMKDAFASVNYGNVEFLGPNQPNPQQIALIDTSSLVEDVIKRQLHEEFKGQTIKFKAIIDKYIDSTPFLERQINQAIRSMENEYLTIEKADSKTRVPKAEDKITFLITPQIKPVQVSLFSV